MLLRAVNNDSGSVVAVGRLFFFTSSFWPAEELLSLILPSKMASITEDGSPPWLAINVCQLNIL